MLIYLTYNQALTEAYKDIVLGATSYVEFMELPYLNILSIDPNLLKQTPIKTISSLLEFIPKIIVVVGAPLIGPVILIYSCLKRNLPHKQLLLFLGLICSASFLFLFPRSDYPHLAFALPILFVGTTVSFAVIAVGSKWKKNTFRVVGVYLVAVSLLISTIKVTDIYQGNLKYIPISASFVSSGVEQAVQLTLNSLNQTQANGKKTIILDPSLSLYYPYLKISNPTRYDFPTKGNFGVNNGSDVIAYLKNNPNICLYASKSTAQEEFYPSHILNLIQPPFKFDSSVAHWNIYCRN